MSKVMELRTGPNGIRTIGPKWRLVHIPHPFHYVSRTVRIEKQQAMWAGEKERRRRFRAHVPWAMVFRGCTDEVWAAVTENRVADGFYCASRAARSFRQIWLPVP
jgi:hypothetical protein